MKVSEIHCECLAGCCISHYHQHCFYRAVHIHFSDCRQDARRGSPLPVQLAEQVSIDREPPGSHGIWRQSYVPERYGTARS